MIPLLLGGAALGAGLWLGRIHWFGQRRHREPLHPRPVVVLGARIRPDGSPTPAVVSRVAVAVGLFKSGHASRLVLSGGSPDARPTEASVMRRLAIEAGVDSGACELEASSLSTRDNALECSRILPAEREILLVTCDFHLLRATRWFQAQGFTVYPVASRRRLTVGERLRASLHEAVSLLGAP